MHDFKMRTKREDTADGSTVFNVYVYNETGRELIKFPALSADFAADLMSDLADAIEISTPLTVEVIDGVEIVETADAAA